jgi:hypothetical protein
LELYSHIIDIRCEIIYWNFLDIMNKDHSINDDFKFCKIYAYREVLKLAIIGKPIEILLVGDNKGDFGLIEEVFEEAKIRSIFHVAENGEEDLFLSGTNT